MNDFTSKLYSEPFALLPSAFGDLLQRSRELTPEARSDDQVGFTDYRGRTIYPQVEMIGPVAKVPVQGVIGRHESPLMTYWYGLADSYLLQEQLRNVREDSDVEIVVLDIRSRGGLAIGLEEVTDDIRRISEAGKPVIAWVDHIAASAAYRIAAACDAIYAEPCAVVGSISTIMSGVDSSKRWENEGLELKLFAGGDLKALGMPGKKWTEAEEKHVQERLDLYNSKFKDYIRARRAVTDDHMRGQTWEAKEVSGVLVDGYANSLAELIAGLLS